MEDQSLVVYADYVCPFCYLGRRALEQYRETRDTPLAVEWHPFDLRAGQRDESGEIVRESPKDDAYFDQARRNVERLAEEYGVAMPDDPIMDVDSLPAQRVSLHVQRNHPEAWDDFDAGLYKALWQEQRDIADPDVLAGVADSAGIDPGIVETALEAHSRGELEERFGAPRQRGITGVPTFVYGEDVARGAVPPSQLRRFVEGTD